MATQQAIVRAAEASTYQGLAKSLIDKEASNLLRSGVEAEEVARSRPVDLMQHWLDTLSDEELGRIPEPFAFTGNNPDLVKFYGVDPRNGKVQDGGTSISSFRLIFWQSDDGIENCRQLRALNTKEGRTAAEDAEIARLTQWETQYVKKLRQAAALLFTMNQVNQFEKIGCRVHGEYTDKDGNKVSMIEAESLLTSEEGRTEYQARGIKFTPSRSNKPIHLYGVHVFKNPKTGQVEYKENPEQSVNLAVTSFIGLNPYPFDAKTNPEGMKGDDWEALRATSRRGTQADGVGDNGGTEGEDDDSEVAVTAIKNDEQFSHYLLAVIDYLNRVTANAKKAKAAIQGASDDKLLEIGTAAELLNDLMDIPGVRERYQALNEAAENAAGNGKKETAAA